MRCHINIFLVVALKIRIRNTLIVDAREPQNLYVIKQRDVKRLAHERIDFHPVFEADIRSTEEAGESLVQYCSAGEAHVREEGDRLLEWRADVDVFVVWIIRAYD
jgi:hypothetical protein